MLFMVIETFKPEALDLVRQRFQEQGRMIPEGAIYRDSWMEAIGSRCYQLMEANSLDPITEWTRNWEDLVDFEIVPIVTSADFWSSRH